MNNIQKDIRFESRGGGGSQGIKADDRHAMLRKELVDLFKRRPMVDEQLLTNLGLYMRSSVLASTLFREEAYKKILNIPGDILVFGLWWGQDAILFENLRAIYEPYNLNRRIVGFDTFGGYPGEDIGENDRPSEVISEGVYAVPDQYELYLSELMAYHTRENSLYRTNTVKFVKGDVLKTVPDYYKKHSERITALAYFDMALYEPTKICLQHILKTCIKGSVIVFDELNREEYPGETLALKELVDLNGARIEKSEVLPDRTFLII